MENTIPEEHKVILDYDKAKPRQVVRVYNWTLVHNEIGFETLDEAIGDQLITEHGRVAGLLTGDGVAALGAIPQGTRLRLTIEEDE